MKKVLLSFLLLGACFGLSGCNDGAAIAASAAAGFVAGAVVGTATTPYYYRPPFVLPPHVVVVPPRPPLEYSPLYPRHRPLPRGHRRMRGFGPVSFNPTESGVAVAESKGHLGRNELESVWQQLTSSQISEAFGLSPKGGELILEALERGVGGDQHALSALGIGLRDQFRIFTLGDMPEDLCIRVTQKMEMGNGTACNSNVEAFAEKVVFEVRQALLDEGENEEI